MAFTHSRFTQGTAGERFVRLDQYGVAETMILDTTSTSVILTSVGGGETLISGVIGTDVQLKSLIAGTNITFAPVTVTDLTINSGGGGAGITTIADSGVGDVGLVKTGTAPTAVLKQLTAGTAISVADSGDDITIANTVSLASTGTGETLLSSTALPSFSTKSLVAGSGITLTPSGTEISIAAPAGATYSIADSSVSGDATVINDGVGPAFLLKRITGGTDIAVTENADEVIITNTGVGTTPSITSLPGDEALIPGSPQTTFTFTIKSLTAGSGIGLSSDGNAITITNTGVAQVYTLSDAAGATGSTIIAAPSPTANDFRLYTLKAGSGIGISLVGSDLTITNTNPGGGSSITLSSAGGTSIVTSGTGPALAVKGTGGTNLLQDVSTATQIKFDNIGIRIRDASNNMPPTSGSSSVGATGPQVAIGYNCSSSGSNGCSVGISNTLSIRGQAWGRSNTVSQLDSMAFGVGNVITTAGATQGLAVGNANTITGANAVAVGSSCTAAAQGVAIGNVASATGSGSVAVGRSSTASTSGAVAYGWGATASGTEATALGRASSATGAQSIALGRTAIATAAGATAIGYNVRCAGVNSTAIGASDDSSYDFAQGAPEVFVVADRVAGTTRWAAVHGFSSWTNRPWWSGQRTTVVATASMNVGSFYSGMVFMDSGIAAGQTASFPTTSSFATQDVVTKRAAEDGSWVTIRNQSTTQSVTLNAAAGSGLRWRSTSGTINSAPFTKTLGASQMITLRWHWDSASQITFTPITAFQTIPA